MQKTLELSLRSAAGLQSMNPEDRCGLHLHFPPTSRSVPVPTPSFPDGGCKATAAEWPVTRQAPDHQ